MTDQHRCRPRPATGGFSLTELIIAILVIAIGAIPVFIMFSQGSTGTIQTRDEMLAYNYAADLIHWCHAQGFEQLPVGASDRTTLTLNPTAGPAVSLAMEPGFTRELTVSEPALAAGTDPWPYRYRVVVARVAWIPAGGIQRELRMSAMVFRGQ